MFMGQILLMPHLSFYKLNDQLEKSSVLMFLLWMDLWSRLTNRPSEWERQPAAPFRRWSCPPPSQGVTSCVQTWTTSLTAGTPELRLVWFYELLANHLDFSWFQAGRRLSHLLVSISLVNQKSFSTLRLSCVSPAEFWRVFRRCRNTEKTEVQTCGKFWFARSVWTNCNSLFWVKSDFYEAFQNIHKEIIKFMFFLTKSL